MKKKELKRIHADEVKFLNSRLELQSREIEALERQVRMHIQQLEEEKKQVAKQGVLKGELTAAQASIVKLKDKYSLLNNHLQKEMTLRRSYAEAALFEARVAAFLTSHAFYGYCEVPDDEDPENCAPSKRGLNCRWCRMKAARIATEMII